MWALNCCALWGCDYAEVVEEWGDFSRVMPDQYYQDPEAILLCQLAGGIDLNSTTPSDLSLPYILATLKHLQYAFSGLTVQQALPGLEGGQKTLLHILVERNWYNSVAAVIANGWLEVLNKANDQGLFPLHLAATLGHTQMLALLLQGSDLAESLSGQGHTALQYAASHGRWGCVQVLCARGARFPRTGNLLGQYALNDIVAAQRIDPIQQAQILQFLLNAQFPWSADALGADPLQHAVRHQKLTLLRLLLSHMGDHIPEHPLKAQIPELLQLGDDQLLESLSRNPAVRGNAHHAHPSAGVPSSTVPANRLYTRIQGQNLQTPASGFVSSMSRIQITYKPF